MIRLKVKNIIIFSILTILFGVGVSALAVTQKPILRDTKLTQMKLEGDIQFTRTNPKITLSLRDSDVQQVLRMFADKAGLNIMFHNSVPKDKKITLDLVNVPLKVNNSYFFSVIVLPPLLVLFSVVVVVVVVVSVIVITSLSN